MLLLLLATSPLMSYGTFYCLKGQTYISEDERLQYCKAHSSLYAFTVQSSPQKDFVVAHLQDAVLVLHVVIKQLFNKTSKMTTLAQDADGVISGNECTLRTKQFYIKLDVLCILKEPQNDTGFSGVSRYIIVNGLCPFGKLHVNQKLLIASDSVEQGTSVFNGLEKTDVVIHLTKLYHPTKSILSEASRSCSLRQQRVPDGGLADDTLHVCPSDGNQQMSCKSSMLTVTLRHIITLCLSITILNLMYL